MAALGRCRMQRTRLAAFVMGTNDLAKDMRAAQTADRAPALFALTWLAFFAWSREHKPSRLPPERIDRAVGAGLRYLTAMEKRGVVERRDGDWTLGLTLVELASRVKLVGAEFQMMSSCEQTA